MGLGHKYGVYKNTFDSYKVILRSFGVFPIFDSFRFSKWLVVEQNGLKWAWPEWQIFFVYRGLLTVKHLRSL